MVQNRGTLPLNVTLHDDPGELCDIDRLPQTVRVEPGKEVEVVYAIRPRRRGASEMPAVHLRFPTRLGLWFRQQVRPLKTPIRIYPDIRAVYRYELMARQNRLSEIGVRMVRMPGRDENSNDSASSATATRFVRLTGKPRLGSAN